MATFGLMACGVMALPLKFPFYDNLLLLVYCAFTYLLAANSAAYAFGQRETSIKLTTGSEDGSGDRQAILARARVPLLVGLGGWALLVALSLVSLKSVRVAAPMPSWTALAGMAAMNAGVAWLVTMMGVLVGLNVQTVKGTRDLLRMGLTFALVLVVLGYFLSPEAWRVSIGRLTRRDLALGAALAVVGIVLGLGGELVLRRALGLLAEKRQGLSILG